MMTPFALREYVKAEPFRPFQIHTASGKTFEVRLPEMIKVLKSYAIIFKAEGDNVDFPEEFTTVSLMLSESISYLETPVR